MADTARTPAVGSLTQAPESPRLANPTVAVPANNVITVSGTLTLAKSLMRASLSGSLRAGQAGDEYVQAIQDVGTTEELINVGGIGIVGWCAFRNNDTTNYVQLGSTPGNYTLKLGPGEYHGPMQWDGPLIYAKANTATCKVEYLVIER